MSDAKCHQCGRERGERSRGGCFMSDSDECVLMVTIERIELMRDARDARDRADRFEAAMFEYRRMRDDAWAEQKKLRTEVVKLHNTIKDLRKAAEAATITKPADTRPRRTYRTATGTIDLSVGDVIEGTEGRGRSWQNTARLKVLYLINSDSSVFARDLSTSKEGPWFTFCRDWEHVTEEGSKP